MSALQRRSFLQKVTELRRDGKAAVERILKDMKAEAARQRAAKQP